MRFDVVVARGLVIDASGRRAADVGIRAGRIVEVAPGLAPAAARVLDVDGAWVVPGGIDAHVHPIHGETLRSVGSAAAAGGVTTVLHHVYPEPERSMEGWLRVFLEEAARESAVDFGLHARLRSDSPAHLAELGAVAALGVRTFKVFMTYRTPGVAVDGPRLTAILKAVRAVRGLVLVHAESDRVIRGRAAGASTQADGVLAYLLSRPAVAEAAAARTVIGRAQRAGVPVYLVHISSRRALAEIARARAVGARVMVETCPHYLVLTRDAVWQQGARAKIAPPLRTRLDQSALWAGLRTGAVDLVASDHCGYPAAMKEPTAVPFADAGLGTPGVQTLVPVLLDAAIGGRIAPERAVAAMAARPAEVFGLHRKGRISPGADADLLVVDPAGTTTIAATDLRGAAYYSLLEGAVLRGRIVHVLLRGKDPRDGYRPRGRFLATDPQV